MQPVGIVIITFKRTFPCQCGLDNGRDCNYNQCPFSYHLVEYTAWLKKKEAKDLKLPKICNNGCIYERENSNPGGKKFKIETKLLNVDLNLTSLIDDWYCFKKGKEEVKCFDGLYNLIFSNNITCFQSKG